MTYSNTQFYVSNHVDLTIIPPRIPWNPYNDEQMLVVVCFNYSLMNVYERNNSQLQTITDAKRYIILMYSPTPTTSMLHACPSTLLVVKYCNEFCCVCVAVYGSAKQRQPKNQHDTTPLQERPTISRRWGLAVHHYLTPHNVNWCILVRVFWNSLSDRQNLWAVRCWSDW